MRDINRALTSIAAAGILAGMTDPTQMVAGMKAEAAERLPGARLGFIARQAPDGMLRCGVSQDGLTRFAAAKRI